MSGMQGLSAAAQADIRQHEERVREVERMERQHKMYVPTRDSTVRACLRRVAEPMTLFAEDEAGRQERLRGIMVRLDLAGVDFATVFGELIGDEARAAEAATEDQGPRELVYTEGSGELVAARSAILTWSLARARARLAVWRAKETEPGRAEEKARHEAALGRARGFEVVLSQAAHRRAVSAIGVSTDGGQVATGSWSSVVKVWDAETSELEAALVGHAGRVSGLSWRPGAAMLASCASTTEIALWSLSEGRAGASADAGAAATAATAHLCEQIEADVRRVYATAMLRGHQARVSRVAWHPAGQHVVSTSLDHTWRMWDAETQQELLLQDGHARGVYALAMHPDGSLVATAGFDHLGRLWDLRTGECVMVMRGHSDRVLALACSPDGHTVASGGKDNSVIIWELRKRRAVHSLPAHRKLVSCLQFEPVGGHYLVSGGYDRMCKVWDVRTWRLESSLPGHEDKVMAMDMHPQGAWVVTGCFDRSWKKWEPPQ